MNIAIIGTRGIPNNYGGFEQFAEYLSQYLVSQRHDVTVYNPHNHSYKESTWNGVNIVHCYDPEFLIGTIGQFIYDYNCILNTRKNKFDIILQLGYTSSSVWSFLFPDSSLIITNMDGLEWKRTKYSAPVRRFLKFAEAIAARNSHVLVADSVGIEKYLFDKYQLNSHFIPYGAHLFLNPDKGELDKMHLTPYEYDILIARMEPENNIEMILEGINRMEKPRTMIVVGSTENRFGSFLRRKYSGNLNIKFVGAIYNIKTLNNLRHFSNIYFHGHSVGGTNPSLLEAMASNALICAHDNVFNKAILEANAYYFRSADDVLEIATKCKKQGEELEKLKGNSDKIKSIYSWESVNKQYEKLFVSELDKKNHQK